jgi:hypothetical protein
VILWPLSQSIQLYERVPMTLKRRWGGDSRLVGSYYIYIIFIYAQERQFSVTVYHSYSQHFEPYGSLINNLEPTLTFKQ